MGRAERKRLLRVPGEDAFLSLATFTEDRINPDRVLNDCGPMVGRESGLATLGEALAREERRPVVVLVTGPGGRGKTRLLVEALSAFEIAPLGMPVVFASPGVRLDSVALGELPQPPAPPKGTVTGISHCVRSIPATKSWILEPSHTANSRFWRPIQPSTGNCGIAPGDDVLRRKRDHADTLSVVSD